MKRLFVFGFAGLFAMCSHAGYANDPIKPKSFVSNAPIAYMIDLSSGATLYNKQATKRIAPASMTKMLTTHVAFDLISTGKLSLNDVMTVRPETWSKWHGPKAGSTMFLKSGEKVRVEDLLHGIVTLSGNDASIVFAEGVAGSEAAFVAMMNAKAKALGMNGSYFNTANGWPDAGKTYSTAQDLAKLGVSTLRKYPDLYKKFYGQKGFKWNGVAQPNRNPILGKIAGADGMKTGHTDEAGYCFVGSAVQGKRRLVMVVAGLPTYESRVTESVRFMDWGFKSWTTKPLAPKGRVVGKVAVQQGNNTNVAVATPADVAVTLPADNMGQGYAVNIAYKGPLKAPIAKGAVIAELIVKADGMEVQRTPLIASEAVEEAGFFMRSWLGLKSLVGLA
jgi:serine-type D-Ala-D-Ala carboxypeptidase (penicillin-binding protein 5/6)